MRHSAGTWSGKTSEVPFCGLGGANSPYFTATALGRNRGTKLRHRLEEKTGSKGPFLQTAPQLF